MDDDLTALPPPLTGEHCDLRDYRFMPLYIDGFRDSDMVADETPEACWASMLIQAASWHQVPAASIPNDDNWIAKVANYRMRGKTDRRWRKIKDSALKGWIKCSDGRLYHPDVAQLANEAWDSKLKQRYRTECARLAKAQLPRPDYQEWLAQGCPLGVNGDKFLNNKAFQAPRPLDSKLASNSHPLDDELALTSHPLDLQETEIEIEIETETEKGKRHIKSIAGCAADGGQPANARANGQPVDDLNDGENAQNTSKGTTKSTESQTQGTMQNAQNASKSTASQKEAEASEPSTPLTSPLLKQAKLPAKAKSKTAETELQALCRETWEHYSGAYQKEYGVNPVRNAKVNGQIKMLCQRLGKDAPQVAAFYIGINDRWYLRKSHCLDALLKDCEGIRTQWATNRPMNTVIAQQKENTQANVSVMESLAQRLEKKFAHKNLTETHTKPNENLITGEPLFNLSHSLTIEHNAPESYA